MKGHSLSHLPDALLLRRLTRLAARERVTTAALLAYIAEVDARRLYLPAAHPSMHSYCVHELGFSEDAAFKRIRAARAAREFPVILDMIADGRLHVTSVIMLAPRLTASNADELLARAAHRNKAEIERLLVETFAAPELAVSVEAVSPQRPVAQLAPERVLSNTAKQAETPSSDRPTMTPVASERFTLQVTISQSTHDKLRYARELAGHQIPNTGIAEVLDRALDALIRQLEKQKFAATSRPQARRRESTNPRTIPAHVRRAVWDRDGAQCTFVSDDGRRCPARTRLEFDHADPVARGGEATTENIRLRCRAHNQHVAECVYGAEFMQNKREAARRAVECAQEERAKAERTRAATAEVIPWLRQLGFRADEARRGAAASASIDHAPLEERVRIALSALARPVSAVASSVPRDMLHRGGAA